MLQAHYEDFLARDWEETTGGGPVRFAVVGLGSFGRGRAIPALRAADRCEPTVAVGWSAETARPVAEEFGMVEAIGYDEFHDGVASDAFDAVYVATPNATHLEYAERAAALGKHVLCEKPLEVTVERGERIVDACEDAGVTLMVGYRIQLEPVVRRTRELIADGFVGDPAHLHADFSNRLPTDGTASNWRFDPEMAGGGALIDLGIYPLNTARFLLGMDPASVYGSTTSLDEAFANVDEDVTFHLSFPSGLDATCTASYNAYPTSWLGVTGTEGQIRIASPFGGVVPHRIVAEREDMRTEYTGPSVDEVIEEFEYFAHCVLTNATPEPDGRDGIADLAAIDAIYESAETGCRVTVPPA